MNDEIISYECLRAAGVDPGLLHTCEICVEGSGHAGSNIVQSAATLGIGAAYIDLDVVEPKNLPHSPYLDARSHPDGSPRLKAEALAQAHVAMSRRPGQLAYWAGTHIQAIPWGVIRRFKGIIVGIDDGPSRAWAANVGALLNIPTIVVGFYPPTGHFVATANRDPDAPCYRCLRPKESPIRASCARYADSEEEVHPALQTAAAATMNVALDAMIRFWHGDDRYDGKVFRLDLDQGSAELTDFRRHPSCPGSHERFPDVELAPFDCDAPAEQVLELARHRGIREPVLKLPSPIILTEPCRSCGTSVAVEQPDWAASGSPRCQGSCPPSAKQAGSHSEGEVHPGTPLASWPLRRLGLGPLAVCLVEDESTSQRCAFELPGRLDDVLHRVEKLDE